MSDSFDLQQHLQKQANDLVELLKLTPLLRTIGEPVRVGSSALGVMVRRNIDITVICTDVGAATRATFAQIGARLMLLDRDVSSVRFRNDTGAWNIDPAGYPDGLYLGVSARSPDGADWTLDIWAIDQPERQPDLKHLRTLLPRLNDDLRRTILTIKEALLATRLERPLDQHIPSAYVYEAVLDMGVTTLKEFLGWLPKRRMQSSH